MLRALIGRPFQSLSLLVALGLAVPVIATAGPLENAQQMVDSGLKLIKDAKRARSKKKNDLYVKGLKKFARAYMLISSQKLQNDAPDLFSAIEQHLTTTNALPEVAIIRQQLLSEAIDAAAKKELTKAYDRFAALGDMDPRDKSIGYALQVLNGRIGDN